MFTQTSAYAGVTQARVFDTDFAGGGRAVLFARPSSGGTAYAHKGNVDLITRTGDAVTAPDHGRLNRRG